MITTVQEAKNFLYSFANYEAKMPQVYNTRYFNLEQFRQFLDMLNSPDRFFPSIHIAGTKGKGSTAAVLASVLRHSGYCTGLYHSPHVRDVRERIQVNGTWIPENDFIDVCAQVASAVGKFGEFEKNYRTTFELLTAMALMYFRKAPVEIAVIETGLGGRLDSTNVLQPILSVITRIGKDHTRLLGRTLARISGEKGGIIKNGIPVVTGRQHHLVKPVLWDISVSRNAPVIHAPDLVPIKKIELSDTGSRFHVTAGKFQGEYFMNLSGEHQLDNACTAFAALEAISHRFPGITVKSIQEGLRNLAWEGRFQVIRRHTMPVILLDGAHNPDSIRSLVKSIRKLIRYRRATCIFAVSRDKNVEQIAKILAGTFQKVVLPSTSTPRSMPPDILYSRIKGLFREIVVTGDPREALNAAMANADPGDLICITGSFYLVGDMLEILDKIR